MKLWQIVIVIIVALILGSAVRGYAGNPTSDDLNTNFWKDDGPLELSPERGRYALVYSIMEDKSLHFSVPIARFATPDLGYINGNFVSLFAPGVSYLVLPGYMIGKYFGASQVGTYAFVALAALLNFILIMQISRLFGTSRQAGVLGALAYLFASPAFAYAVTLYQHHITVLLMLTCIYILMKFKESLWPLLLVWILCGFSIIIDYPNLFLFFPIGMYALNRVFQVQKVKTNFVVSVRYLGLVTMISLIIPLSFFLWFNKESYGSGLQFSGTVQSVQNLSETGEVQYMTAGNEEETAGPDTDKSSVGFFDTRDMRDGLYVLLFSRDRGSLIFTPLILFGFIGLYYAFSKFRAETVLILAVCLINIILYSMWGDPHGGWAFGSRYMIPSYAVLGIGLAYLFHHSRRNIIFLLISLPIFYYCLAVNSIGAYTTNRIPPEVQVLELEALSGRVEKYSYDRAYDMLLTNDSKSFFFHSVAKNYVTAWQLYASVVLMLSVIATSLVIGITRSNRKIHVRS